MLHGGQRSELWQNSGALRRAGVNRALWAASGSERRGAMCAVGSRSRRAKCAGLGRCAHAGRLSMSGAQRRRRARFARARRSAHLSVGAGRVAKLPPCAASGACRPLAALLERGEPRRAPAAAATSSSRGPGWPLTARSSRGDAPPPSAPRARGCALLPDGGHRARQRRSLRARPPEKEGLIPCAEEGNFASRALSLINIWGVC